MTLKCCFEKAYIQKTFANSKRNALAVVDTEGYES